VTVLGSLADDLAASTLGSPAIIVVGEVVRYADAAQLSSWSHQSRSANRTDRANSEAPVQIGETIVHVELPAGIL
jgi:hypothetical protein